MSEPILTDSSNGGRPQISEEQYKIWIEELRPYLEMSNSLYRACVKAGLEAHYDSLRIKYRLNDWFSVKIDAYRSLPGETVNEIYVRLVNQISSKVKKEEILTKEELDILKHFSEKHRSSQAFFTNRQEVAQVTNNDIADLIKELDGQSDTIDDVAEHYRKEDEQKDQLQISDISSPEMMTTASP